MKPILLASGLVLAIGTALPAWAQSPPEGQILASDPQSLMNFFFEQGIPAQLSSDSVGDPLVEFRVNSDTQQIFFYDCTENQNCLALQFYSGYRLDNPVSLETVNSWNTDRRFVRAYRTDDGAARIEMDIATSKDGISSRDFKDLYDLWVESVGLFEERIGF